MAKPTNNQPTNQPTHKPPPSHYFAHFIAFSRNNNHSPAAAAPSASAAARLFGVSFVLCTLSESVYRLSGTAPPSSDYYVVMSSLALALARCLSFVDPACLLSLSFCVSSPSNQLMCYHSFIAAVAINRVCCPALLCGPAVWSFSFSFSFSVFVCFVCLFVCLFVCCAGVLFCLVFFLLCREVCRVSLHV